MSDEPIIDEPIIDEPIIDEQGRIDPPVAGNETEVLLGFLEFHRATLAWKCAGLDSAQLAQTAGTSVMNLGGMLKHLTIVENFWFSVRMAGGEIGAPWNAVDWDADEDWDWHSAADDTPEELRSMWGAEVERSREITADTLALPTGLDTLAAKPMRDGRSPSLRWIVVHMIEEYARHNGHADLLRESIDGQTGE